MAQEIERKFLVDGPPRWLESCPRSEIEQGYLAAGEDGEVRLRRLDDRLMLTTKRGTGQVRREAEVELRPSQFDKLWPLTEGRRVQKARHYVARDGRPIEVDVYRQGLQGLVTAEVEFGSEEESRSFEPPEWLGAEVTGDRRYANERLALEGLPVAGR